MAQMVSGEEGRRHEMTKKEGRRKAGRHQLRNEGGISVSSRSSGKACDLKAEEGGGYVLVSAKAGRRM